MYLKINETKNYFQLKTFAILCAIACAICFALGVQMIASASEEGGNSGGSNCEQLPAIEEMFRLGLTPSLNMTEGEGLATSVGMTDESKASDSTEATDWQSDATLSAKRVGQRAMYRLYNPYSGEHFYTCDEKERDNVVKAGWKNESIGWVAPKTSSIPVYRVYNKYAGDHHYTPNKSERDALVKAGWNDEGIGWYSADEGSLFRAPVYRQYNPYGWVGTHNYTLSTKEKSNLVKAGWKDEGVGYYGLDQSKMSSVNFEKDIKVTTTSKVYNGKAQTQTITSSTMKEGEDYVVEYSNNVNVGTATITITGTNGFYGERKYTFKITQKPITQVKWSATEFGYNGKAQAPTATAVGLCGKDTANITVVASGKHTEPGNYTATATAISNKNYKLVGKIQTDFRIGTKVDFDGKNKVTVDTKAEVYNGTNITKDVSVAGLTKDKDYSVTYKNNKDVGIAELVIKGIGSYFGEKTYKFEITQLDISNAEVTLGESLTYNAAQQTQNVASVKVGDVIVPVADYQVTNNQQTNAGAYDGDNALKITPKTNNVKGMPTKQWSISALDITGATITLGEALTYNATQQTQTVTSVKVGDLTVPVADYNVINNEQTNAGTYKDDEALKITPKTSNVTGTPTKQWAISALDIKDAEITLGDALTYNGSQQEQTVASVKVGELTVPTTDYEVTGNQQKDAGTYKDTNALKITPKTTNVTGTPTKQWTISALDIAEATITLGDALTYNATQQTQTVSSVKVGTIELSASDYDLSGNTGKNAGSDYALKVKGKGNFTGEKTKSFEIAKAPLKLKWSNTTFTYDKTQHHPDAAVDSGNKGSDTITVSVAGEETNANKTGESYTATASLDTTSANNYEITTDTKTQTFTIAQATPVYSPTGLKGDFGKALSTVNLPDPASTETPAESIDWTSGSTLMNDKGSNKFTVTFIPSDTTNYKTLTDLEVAVEVVGVKATFNASAPATGYTITMDDASVNSTVKRLAFDDKTVASTVHTYATADFPKVKVTSANSDGYYLAGWATTSTATYAPTAKQMVDTTVSSDIQYYAVWATPKGYWLGSAGATASFTDEAYFAENDINFHSAAEIESDMGVLHNSSATTYTTVKDKWDAYYNGADSSTTGKGNKIRLYATYSGGESQPQLDGTTSVLNKYVEFRILQVGEHDSDGSAVTFMATHLLPKAYSMNSKDSNDGGWGSSALKSVLNSGEVWDKFSTDLKNTIHAVQKTYGTGNATTNTTRETTSNASKFWILSNSELGGSDAPISEGSQYAWCYKEGIAYSATPNDALAKWKTRAKAYPGSNYYDDAYWWSRSPYSSFDNCFTYIHSGGSIIDNYYQANYCWGVAPSFCF